MYVILFMYFLGEKQSNTKLYSSILKDIESIPILLLGPKKANESFLLNVSEVNLLYYQHK